MLTGHRLLDALPDTEYRRLLLAPEVVTLGTRSLPTVSAGRIGYVYFPIGCLLVQVVQQRSGSSPQAVMLGRSGVLGLPVFLGSQELLFQARVAISGRALRVRTEDFRIAIERNAALRNLLGRYTLVLMFQMAQQSACNARCHADQRVARWLLFASDEIGQDHLAITHERIARLLSVRRATVTRSFQTFEDRGILRGARGSIRIVDRAGLEAMACECYRDLREHYDRLYPTSRADVPGDARPVPNGLIAGRA
jgi:CRP-like cAMP-binding protein